MTSHGERVHRSDHPITSSKGMGCQFVSSSCYNWTEAQGGCKLEGKCGCFLDLSAKALCSLTRFDSDLPKKYQYFNDPRVGGSSSLADYCPIFSGYRDCRFPSVSPSTSFLVLLESRMMTMSTTTTERHFHLKASASHIKCTRMIQLLFSPLKRKKSMRAIPVVVLLQARSK